MEWSVLFQKSMMGNFMDTLNFIKKIEVDEDPSKTKILKGIKQAVKASRPANPPKEIL